MLTPSIAMSALARSLVAASRSAADPAPDELGAVMERLRTSLARFAGVESFATLLMRALALAGAHEPALRDIRVDADGRLQGAEVLAAKADRLAREEAAAAVTAQLLELLVTFIGESLTRMLVREAWPDADLDVHTSGSEAD